MLIVAIETRRERRKEEIESFLWFFEGLGSVLFWQQFNELSKFWYFVVILTLRLKTFVVVNFFKDSKFNLFFKGHSQIMSIPSSSFSAIEFQIALELSGYILDIINEGLPIISYSSKCLPLGCSFLPLNLPAILIKITLKHKILFFKDGATFLKLIVDQYYSTILKFSDLKE